MEIISRYENPLQPYLSLSMLAKDNGGPKELLNQIYLKGCRDTASAAKTYYSSLENEVNDLTKMVARLSHGNNVRDGIITVLGSVITIGIGAWIASKKEKTSDKKSTNNRKIEASGELCD